MRLFDIVREILVLSIVAAVRLDDEHWLRREDEVGRFLAGNAHTCEFARVDERSITWSDFKKGLEQQSDGASGLAILTSLAEEDSWLAPSRWGRARFLDAFGSYEVRVNSARYDPGEVDELVEVSKYVGAATLSNRSVVAVGYDTPLSAELVLSPGEPLPPMLRDFDLRPVVQLAAGGAGSGTHLHRHMETWLALLLGSKAWWVASSDVLPEATRSEMETHTAHPCSWLNKGAPPGLSFCVQRPGEVVYFPSGRAHATCNLDEFTLGIGAQGHLPEAWPPVLRALHRGQLETVISLVEEGDGRGASDHMMPYIEPIGKRQNTTALVEAARKGFLPVVTYLLGRRADVHGGKVASVESPLQAAAEKGHRAVVAALLSARADATGTDPMRISADGFTALHSAALGGSIGVVDQLLTARAAVAAKDTSGQQPLHQAARMGCAHVVERLLRHRANPTVASSMHGMIPLHRAAINGHAGAAEMLLAAAHTKQQLQAKDANGRTSLFLAVEGGHRAVSRLLLRQRADPSATNNGGMHPLHQSAGSGQATLAKWLLGKRADVHASFQDGFSPLMLAAQEGHLSTTKTLLAARADIVQRSGGGLQAVHFAAMGGHATITRLLVKLGADPDASDNGGNTPKTVAKEHGHSDVSNFLETAVIAGGGRRDALRAEL